MVHLSLSPETRKKGCFIFDDGADAGREKGLYYWDSTAGATGAGDWVPLAGEAITFPTAVRTTTAPHDGKFDDDYASEGITNGRQGMQRWIQENGCSDGYHPCDAIELIRYAQKNGDIGLSGWYSTGITAVMVEAGSLINDCEGWTNNQGGPLQDYGLRWNDGGVLNAGCSGLYPVMCCK